MGRVPFGTRPLPLAQRKLETARKCLTGILVCTARTLVTPVQGSSRRILSSGSKMPFGIKRFLGLLT